MTLYPDLNLSEIYRERTDQGRELHLLGHCGHSNVLSQEIIRDKVLTWGSVSSSTPVTTLATEGGCGACQCWFRA